MKEEMMRVCLFWLAAHIALRKNAARKTQPLFVEAVQGVTLKRLENES